MRHIAMKRDEMDKNEEIDCLQLTTVLHLEVLLDERSIPSEIHS